MNLSANYKIETARALTALAIQNNLIAKSDSEKETANAICIFFKTLIKNLDNDEE